MQLNGSIFLYIDSFIFICLIRKIKKFSIMMAQLSVSYVNTDHQQEFQCLPLYSNSVVNEASFNC